MISNSTFFGNAKYDVSVTNFGPVTDGGNNVDDGTTCGFSKEQHSLLHGHGYPPDLAGILITDTITAVGLAAVVTITNAQLSRWARGGLLDHPDPEGRGKGKSWRWLWKAETLPRALLIARALEPRESSHTPSPRGRSLDHEADVLMFMGYAPRADVLRRRLIPLLSCRESQAEGIDERAECGEAGQRARRLLQHDL